MSSQYPNESTDLMPVDDLPGWRKSLAGALAFGMDMLSARHELSWEEGNRAGVIEGLAQAEEALRLRQSSERQGGRLEIRDVRERTVSAPKIDQVLIDERRLTAPTGAAEAMQRDASSILPADLQPTASQWKAITAATRGVLITGQAGTGKTLALALRVIFLNHYLNEPLATIRLLVGSQDAREEFEKRLSWLFKRWGVKHSQGEVMASISTPTAAALELLHTLPGMEKIRPFELLDKPREVDPKPFDYRLSPAQLALLRSSISALYRSNSRFAELMTGMYRQSLLLEPLEVDHPDVKKRAAIGWTLSQQDQDLCEKVEGLWKAAGAWPLEGITPTRQKVVVRGCEFSLNGYVPRLDAYVLLGFDRTEDRYLTRSPSVRLELFKECAVKQSILQAYLDNKPVIQLDSYEDAKRLVATLKALPVAPPSFNYKLRGESEGAAVEAGFFQVAMLIENLGLGVSQAVGKLNFLQGDPDALFFEALSHFWPEFERQLLANQQPLMTANRLQDLFDERHGANLRHLPASALNRFRHILLDDGQDTCAPTANLLRGLLWELKRRGVAGHDEGFSPPTLTVAGDPMQAVGASHGSSSNLVRHFEHEVRVASPTRAPLTECFRSQQLLVDAAFSVVRNQLEDVQPATSLVPKSKQVPVEIHHLDPIHLTRLVEAGLGGGGDVLVLVDSPASFQMAESALADVVASLRQSGKAGTLKVTSFLRARSFVADTVILAGMFQRKGRSDFRNQLFGLAGRWASNGANHFDALLDQECERLVHLGMGRARERCFWLIPALTSEGNGNSSPTPVVSGAIVDKR
ncbi:hypothetical protein [Pseudomonas nitroreducens]|uniref:hypothetical protein n=1 Tax=Pseudomonas nitroreducens TaxID=46680 RepID=UPI00351D662B